MATWRNAISKSLREVRIHLCQTSESTINTTYEAQKLYIKTSKEFVFQCEMCALVAGYRDFINTHYVEIKKLNPDVPFLIRECSGIQPKIYGRYDFGKETCIPLTDLSSNEVLQKLESLVVSGGQ